MKDHPAETTDWCDRFDQFASTKRQPNAIDCCMI